MSRPVTSILFIGNSYTFQNDLPGLLRMLAASGGEALETESVVVGGWTLEQHWEKGEALEALRGKEWDFVVLQEQSVRPFEDTEKMHASVRRFHDVIRERGARTVLYLTWARKNAPERQKDLTAAYRSIGEEIGAIVVPAGIAWKAILESRLDIVLHDPDLSHPTLAGSYLAACAFYGALFGKTPVGLNAPAGLDGSIVPVLQQAAWRAVTGPSPS
jgi:hypothetical protein